MEQLETQIKALTEIVETLVEMSRSQSAVNAFTESEIQADLHSEPELSEEDFFWRPV